ncbi:hypothetical protein N7456_006689 [Penicillium angulare]|uniref:Nucleoside phosphorylase domain-containing protein n=1 Tax=Penicillium angulare TaxID=116970 RepID=A0A9W9KD52_9EURO|nr:hypothetical protein N7456_006689 [Penicillium angulare]
MSCPPRDTFQIGWICALPIEAAAAAEILDEDFGILEEQDAADSNTYRLGRIGKHHIVIACLPEYGNTSATSVAINMLRTFSKSLKMGLMVGVGGGIPSAAHDIRLGDIVISYPQNTCGGVIQYDMGKAVAGDESKLERTGSLNKPPRVLLTAVNTMRAAELRDEPRYFEYIQNATQRTPRTQQNFGRPTVDRLFQSTWHHSTDTDSCDICPADKEDIRSRRDDTNPHAHYGIVASGNSVIKDAKTRDQIGSSTGALCFEMEAAGLMSEFPCIVIRGVCDYADSHKNKQWQGYAALAAASYTKELLEYVPVSQISQEALATEICGSRILEEIRGTSRRLDRAYDQQKQYHLDQEKRALTDEQRRCHRLFKVNNYVEHKNINPVRVTGTCEWVFKSYTYIQWLESNSPGNDLLLVSADPGCGKSVLARSVIDDLEASGAVTVCYFFFKDNDEQNNLAGALCSVLHQIFSQRPHLLAYAAPACGKNGNKLREEVDELWQIFLEASLADSSHTTICIFDALDECRRKDQDQLIERLQSFHTRNASNLSAPDTLGFLKFLVTTRPYDYIQSRFQGTGGSGPLPYLSLKGEADNDQIRKEIDVVVRTRVTELAKSARLSSEIQSRLEQQLLQMKHRTYLWLHLAINGIRSKFQDSLRPAEESIQLIPPNVTAAYEKILAAVPSDQTSTVRKILKIIVGARRPLTIEEMAVMLGVSVSPHHRVAKDVSLDPIGLDMKIRRLCGLFVFVENSRVYLIHQTAKEFLVNSDTAVNIEGIYPFSLEEANGELSEICVRYLLMKDLWDIKFGPKGDVPSLLTYAAEHWADHVRAASSFFFNKFDPLLAQLYDTSTKNFALWFPIFWKRVMSRHEKPTMHAVHLAAFNGHDRIIRRLVAVDLQIVKKTDGTGSTALFWASRNGHLDCVNFLLDKGSDLNAQGGRLGNALYAASVKGHEDVVRILLDRGADVNAKCRSYNNVKRSTPEETHWMILRDIRDGRVYRRRLHEHSGFWMTEPTDYDGIVQIELSDKEVAHALYAASSKGLKSIVRMLLDKGADVNSPGGLCGNALQGACAEGHSEVVLMLLEAGAYPRHEGLFGCPLFIASANGYREIVIQLIKYGADVNYQIRSRGTALLAACFGGHGNIARLLLEHGADINIQSRFSSYRGNKYQNALQAACIEGHKEIAQMLLEKGANLNASDSFCHNALEGACSGGHIDIVSMLLRWGVSPSLRSRALYFAAVNGHDDIVSQLIECGADVNSKIGSKGTALRTACRAGHYKAVQILLNHGAKVDIHSDEKGSALHAACSWGHDRIAQILLDRGCKLNFQSIDNGAALESACARGYTGIVKMLLDHGAEVNARVQIGHENTNALQTACYEGHDKIVQILLDHGADVNTQSGFYGTALQAACSSDRIKIVHMLLKHGAEVNSCGGIYGTALQVACLQGHDKVIQILLDHGADVNAHAGECLAGLQAACAAGDIKILQILLENGADINAHSSENPTGLQAACYGGHTETVRMLLKYGADVNIQSAYDSRTALEIACSGSRDKVVELLREHMQGGNAKPSNRLPALHSGDNYIIDRIAMLLRA